MRTPSTIALLVCATALVVGCDRKQSVPTPKTSVGPVPAAAAFASAPASDPSLPDAAKAIASQASSASAP